MIIFPIACEGSIIVHISLKQLNWKVNMGSLQPYSTIIIKCFSLQAVIVVVFHWVMDECIASRYRQEAVASFLPLLSLPLALAVCNDSFLLTAALVTYISETVLSCSLHSIYDVTKSWRYRKSSPNESCVKVYTGLYVRSKNWKSQSSHLVDIWSDVCESLEYSSISNYDCQLPHWENLYLLSGESYEIHAHLLSSEKIGNQWQQQLLPF